MDQPKHLTLVIRDGRVPGSLASEIRKFVLREPIGVQVDGDEIKLELITLPPDDPVAVGWANYRGKPGDNCCGCSHPAFKHYALEGPCQVKDCNCTAVEWEIQTASETTEDGILGLA